jgi:hypothetical protein
MQLVTSRVRVTDKHDISHATAQIRFEHTATRSKRDDFLKEGRENCRYFPKPSTKIVSPQKSPITALKLGLWKFAQVENLLLTFDVRIHFFNIKMLFQNTMIFQELRPSAHD